MGLYEEPLRSALVLRLRFIHESYNKPWRRWAHQWVKKMFIDPSPHGQPFWATNIETGDTIKFPKGHSREGQPLFKRRFIPASLFDNPYLSETGDYEAMLLSLPEHQRKQLLEGNWDVNEGAAFPEWDRSIHVVEPFKIPAIMG